MNVNLLAAGVWDAFLEGIKGAAFHTARQPWEIGEKLAMELIEFMPMVAMTPLVSAAQWLEVANAWAPVAESFVAFSTLWAFQLAFFALKMIFKAVPTVG